MLCLYHAAAPASTPLAHRCFTRPTLTRGTDGNHAVWLQVSRGSGVIFYISDTGLRSSHFSMIMACIGEAAAEDRNLQARTAISTGWS